MTEAIPHSVVTSFEDVVSRSPDACALRWKGGSWSYGELNRRANRLAHFLRDAGVRAETPVGVFAARSPETLMAFLAILKAGGAYVPLDPSYPVDRLRFYLEDAAIPCVLADAKEMEKLPATSARVLPLDAALGADHPSTNPDQCTTPGSLAHILYTSGSTGLPKGVLIEHRGVVRLVRNADYVEIRPTDVFLQYASLGFDASTFEIWGAWLNGATLAVPAPGHASLHDLAAGLRSFQVTTLWLTAGLFQVMVEQELDGLAGVRELLTGGDVVSPTHAERFLQRYPDSRLTNGYGPTENTVFTSCHRIRRERPMPARLSIGRPINGAGVVVLDEALRPVERGEIGELVLTGDGLARGYLNRPELTAQSFVHVVDSTGHQVRAYRSGDLGRYDADGRLHFHGRRDDQVKINGIRIEPGEIKSILQAHPQVAAAEVLLLENAGHKRLEIFAVPRPGTEVPESILREFLRSKVPGNWLPPLIRVMSSLPLNRNGKVDRHALIEGIQAKSDSSDFGAAGEPRDFLEKAIWSIWRDLLPVAPTSTRDRFFDLGGDSLSALTMIGGVEKIVGRSIGLRPLREGGTIAAIAAAARATGPVDAPPLMVCGQTGAKKPPLFFAHGDYFFGGLYCQRIVRRLEVDQPFYAIAPHGTFGGDLPGTFEEIAASYLPMIRSVQPTGPYHLGGFCNGALAMYEVARQLIHAGEEVATLVLLDPPDLYLYLLRRKISRIGQLLELNERQCRAVYHRIAEGVDIWQNYGNMRLATELCRRLSAWTVKNLKRLSDKRRADVPSAPNLNFHYYEVMANYEPLPYLGSESVWVILREGEIVRRSRQFSYWSEFIPDAHFQVVPGTHLELKIHMGEIVDIIKTALKHPDMSAGVSAGLAVPAGK
jgi:amino acid adenylation domain-containing protein